jgi:hypothetical protein
LAVGSLVCLGLLSGLVWQRLSAPRVRFDKQWVAARFRAAAVEERESPFVHYLTRSEQAEGFLEALFASRAVEPDREGYGGPINLMVVMDATRRFRRVALIESRETPAYLHGFGDWLKQFERWPLHEPIRYGESVDALTGATVTARAASEILETCRVRAARDIFHRETETVASAAPLSRFVDLDLVTLAVVMALSVLLYLRGRPAYRTLFLAFNLVVLGFVYNLQFSSAHVVRVATFDLPAPENGSLFVLVGGVLLLGLFFGPVYCGYLCPFGAAQELLGRLGLVRQPNREGGWVRRVKYLALAALLLFAFTNRGADLTAFDPLQSAFTGDPGGWMAVLLVIIALFSTLYFRFFCRTLCPTGAFLSLFNRAGLLLRFSPPKAYGDCDLGVRGRLDMDCIQCNRCRERRDRRRRAEPIDADAEAVARSAPAGGFWADAYNLLLVAGVTVAVVVALAASSHSSAPQAAGGSGRPRDVDPAEIRKQIQEGKLSDTEALYYRKLDGETRTPESQTTDIPVR